MLTAGKQKMAEWLRKNSRYRVVVALVLLAGLCGRPNDAIAQGAPPAAKPGGDQAQQLQKMIEDVFKGASPATKADGDQAQQIQKMMEGFFNGVLDGAGNQQTPDNSANIQKLFEKLIEAEGGKGEQAKAQACLLPIMIPRIPGQNDKNANPEDKAKSDELDSHFSNHIAVAFKKEWENLLEITRKGLDLEQEIKEWTLPAPRELYRAELWGNHGLAYLGTAAGRPGAKYRAGDRSSEEGPRNLPPGNSKFSLESRMQVYDVGGPCEFRGRLHPADPRRTGGKFRACHCRAGGGARHIES